MQFVSEESASKALAEMDGQVKYWNRIIHPNIHIYYIGDDFFQVVDGRNIRIHYANKK